MSIQKNAARPGLSNISHSRSPQHLSPPRRGRHDYETSDLQDISPPRRGRHDSPSEDVSHRSVASDLSPPRKIRKRRDLRTFK